MKKLQEINLNVCEKYKTEREIQTECSAKHINRITRPWPAQICEQSAWWDFLIYKTSFRKFGKHNEKQ